MNLKVIVFLYYAKIVLIMYKKRKNKLIYYLNGGNWKSLKLGTFEKLPIFILIFFILTQTVVTNINIIILCRGFLKHLLALFVTRAFIRQKYYCLFVPNQNAIHEKWSLSPKYCTITSGLYRVKTFYIPFTCNLNSLRRFLLIIK